MQASDSVYEKTDLAVLEKFREIVGSGLSRVAIFTHPYPDPDWRRRP
jgi:hypothetical protein